MSLYALLCTIDPKRIELFGSLRADHYAFLINEKNRIRFGGPARAAEGGMPETMIIIIEASSPHDAEDFIAREPYNAHGGFSHVAVRLWSQVIPEVNNGDMQRTLAAERIKSAS